MSGVPELLHRCIAERLWVRQQRRWRAPWHWAEKFGHVFQGINWEPIVADPYQLITQAREDIAAGKPIDIPNLKFRQMSDPNTPDSIPTDQVLLAIDKFEARVNAYYAADWDARLLRVLERGIWD